MVWALVHEGSVLSRYVGVATLAYGALAAGAVALSLMTGHGGPWSMEPWMGGGRVLRIAASLGAGAILASVVIWGTRRLVRRTRWARDLHIAFRGVLGSLSSRHILLFALLSGIAEELFFRGALLPLAGLWVSSLVFGLLHIGPSRRFLPWTGWAVAMGLAFGAIFWATGELAGCLLAHVWINYENMHFIEAHDPEAERRPRRPTPDEPSLVGARRHRSGGLMHP